MISEVFATLNDWFLTPVYDHVVGADGHEAVAKFRDEVRDRIRARLGLPGNHDIVRSVRVAALQALELLLLEYERRVRTMQTKEGSGDEDNPIEFIGVLKEFIQKKFRWRATVDIPPDWTRVEASSVAGQIVPEGPSSEAPVDHMERELLKITGWKALPPRFHRMFRFGENGVPSWNGIPRFLG